MELVIAGTGYPPVLDIIKSQGVNGFIVRGFVDDNKDNWSRDLCEYKILGTFEYLRGKNDFYVVSSIARTCNIRKKSIQRLEQLGARFTNVIDYSVTSHNGITGIGNIIGKNVIIEPGCRIGSHNVISSGVHLGHDTTVGSYCFIGVNTIIQGHCNIEDSAFISAGCIIEPSITVGSGSVCMAGAIIMTNVRRNSLCFSKSAVQCPLGSESVHYAS